MELFQSVLPISLCWTLARRHTSTLRPGSSLVTFYNTNPPVISQNKSRSGKTKQLLQTSNLRTPTAPTPWHRCIFTRWELRHSCRFSHGSLSESHTDCQALQTSWDALWLDMKELWAFWDLWHPNGITWAILYHAFQLHPLTNIDQSSGSSSLAHAIPQNSTVNRHCHHTKPQQLSPVWLPSTACAAGAHVEQGTLRAGPASSATQHRAGPRSPPLLLPVHVEAADGGSVPHVVPARASHAIWGEKALLGPAGTTRPGPVRCDTTRLRPQHRTYQDWCWRGTDWWCCGPYSVASPWCRRDRTKRRDRSTTRAASNRKQRHVYFRRGGQRRDVLPAAPAPGCAGAPGLLWQPLVTASHVRLPWQRVGLAAPGPVPATVTRRYLSLPTSPHRYPPAGEARGRRSLRGLCQRPVPGLARLVPAGSCCVPGGAASGPGDGHKLSSDSCPGPGHPPGAVSRLQAFQRAVTTRVLAREPSLFLKCCLFTET